MVWNRSVWLLLRWSFVKYRTLFSHDENKCMYMDIRIRMDNKYELPKKMMMKMLTVMLMMSNGDSKARSTAQEGNLKTHYRQYLLIIYNKYNFTINIKSEELKLWIILRALKKVESMTKLLGSIRFIRIYCTLMSLSQLETYKLIIKNWYRLWELSNEIARNPTDGSANKPHNNELFNSEKCMKLFDFVLKSIWNEIL